MGNNPKQNNSEPIRSMSETLEYHYGQILRLVVGRFDEREDMQKTPKRMAKALLEMIKKPELDFTTFKDSYANEMIISLGIEFVSLCEHHGLPFFGQAIVGYVPNGVIVGASKVPRLVQYHAAGFNTQERITYSVGNDMHIRVPTALGIGVALQGQHTCMTCRGVKSFGSKMRTQFLFGCMQSGQSREEFLKVVSDGFN